MMRRKMGAEGFMIGFVLDLLCRIQGCSLNITNIRCINFRVIFEGLCSSVY
jgi:hypothetical protein